MSEIKLAIDERPDSKWDTIMSKMDLLSLRIDMLESKSTANDERTSDHDGNNDDVWSQLAVNVTAIVGLQEAVAAKSKWMKCFWGVLLLCGICCTAFLIFQTGKQYMGNRSATNVDFLKNTSYSFPPVVLCADEWLDVRKARATGLSVEAVKYSLSYFDNWHDIEVENATAARQEFDNFYSDNGFESLIDYYKSITIDFDRANDSKKWATMNKSGYFSNTLDTSADGFFMNTGGVCARFRLSNVEGVMSMSFTRGKIFVKTIPAEDNPYFSPDPAWYIFFSRNDFLDSNIREYINIPSNTAVTITFSAKRYVRMRGRWKDKDCKPASEETYDGSPLECAMMCEERMFRHALNCTNIYLMNLPKSHGLDGLCNFVDRLENDTMLLSEYVSPQVMGHVHRNISITCSEECPKRCVRTYYDATVASERPIGETEIGKTLAGVLASQSAPTIILTVLHTAMSEGGILSYVEVSTYGFVNLVTEVGGTLGLFVGATIMSLVQMAVFVIGRVRKRWMNRSTGKLRESTKR